MVTGTQVGCSPALCRGERWVARWNKVPVSDSCRLCGCALVQPELVLHCG
jgi:hypothetical protein